MVADIAGQSMCAWSCVVTFVMGPLLGDLIRLYCISVLTKKNVFIVSMDFGVFFGDLFTGLYCSNPP